MIARQTAAGAHFAFTDRRGGVSAPPYAALNLGGAVGDDPVAVRTNRELAARASGLDPAAVLWMNQVHGRTVVVAEGPWPGGVAPEADGVVTGRPGLALAVLTADCAPVLLADPVAGVTGAAHAGRPGLVAGVVPATVEAMRGLGADPARIVARTGPTVCGPCYEVPAVMRDEVERAVPGSATVTGRGTPAVDIPEGIRQQLLGCGVRDIVLSAVCTRESPGHFSYRRERVTGRLGSYVWLPAPAAGPVPA
ncbi:peptidoglycan editing factor PgeF [Streptomyces sp. ACA25]|uniref:peptidoglycan editing factor PgeF n=1 Tax=Streptomyces sp. ACA25 TaxID=3022596 RepID=UPI002307ACBD|nr:peptidoglycan editing factor PgeF [Streptomyces sp. ACA25]MDB1089861.1 peptidoglycan editing factor PgeF [Streptomyces sp. ACA25]